MVDPRRSSRSPTAAGTPSTSRTTPSPSRRSAGSSATPGEAAVAAFARDRIEAQAGAYREAVESAAPAQRTEALAKALTADGYAATARNAPVGEQLCQHHCPVAHVAEQYPQLCEAETEFFSRLLGTHVQRLATIAHGDGVCTTFIPHGAPQTTESASASTAGRNPA